MSAVVRDKPPLFSRLTIYLVGGLLVAFVVWASLTEVEEISRGDGKVIPAGRTQSVQAAEPGVIKEIFIQVGQIVANGDLLVRLDDTTTTSSLGETEARVRALQARTARLEHEQQGLDNREFDCPAQVMESAPEICENEEKLLKARVENYFNTRSVLQQRLVQRQKELAEAHANRERLKGNLTLSQSELDLITPMVKRKLVAKTELIRSQRDVNELTGQLNTVEETIARLVGAVTEAELQLKELALQLQQEALAEKTTALAELSVLQETARGASTRVARTDIRSPVDGVINAMHVNTLGSFVQPGSVIAEVVPTSEELLVEARITPRDVAFIHPGQKALVKVSAYDFSIYGGLDGEVVTVTPDSIVDQKTGEPYFEVRVRTGKSHLERNGKKFAITPGMICTVDILTGKKTILNYLLKPIVKARHEAFTER